MLYCRSIRRLMLNNFRSMCNTVMVSKFICLNVKTESLEYVVVDGQIFRKLGHGCGLGMGFGFCGVLKVGLIRSSGGKVVVATSTAVSPFLRKFRCEWKKNK